MKKISYFGKEYTVSGDIKWVATDIAGYVETFKQKPSEAALGWLYPDSLLDKLPSGSIDWKNSLRKVEDIIVKEGHPHADLMLKYAMIAQYDDKPWESFECLTTDGDWVGKSPRVNFMPNSKYRLKPQEPKIQVGQIWIDDNGVEVTVTNSPVGIVTVNLELGGESVIWTFLIENFLKNFKRKR